MGIQTEKHMGRNQLIERLSAQVGNRDMAVSILQDRGMLLPGTETLTKKGMMRNSMTAEERAIDRAATRSGRSESDYVYNSTTNRATLKRKS
tara:strand:- start:290 stop:565 length:276 start_codon:yes stop_codon:yes gene_type:complete